MRQQLTQLAQRLADETTCVERFQLDVLLCDRGQQEQGVNDLSGHGQRVVRLLRKMQLLNVVPSDTISLVIGLFCMENFSFGPEARKKLERTLGVPLDRVEKINVKDDVVLTTTVV